MRPVSLWYLFIYLTYINFSSLTSLKRSKTMSSNKINDLKKSETFKNHAKVWKIQYAIIYFLPFHYVMSIEIK